jgi:PIN domain nuclease of toxin-antitoxin system
LPLARPPSEIIREGLGAHGIEYQRLQDEDIRHLRNLPAIHADPFDRLLISHALCQGLKLGTPDAEIAKYPVPVIW